MECTKLNCPMQVGTVTENCGDSCPWRTTVKLDDLISRAAATRAAVISVRDYLGNIDSERDIHIEEGLHEVPAVDAIPVEWMRNVLEEAKEFPRSEHETIVAIPYLIKRWQKEQEAR